MRYRRAVWALALCIVATSMCGRAVAAPLLEAFAGVVGGAPSGVGIPGVCSTYRGPEPLFSFFGSGTGVSVPIGGIAACGYSGDLNDVTAVSGPLSTSETLSPVLLGNPGFAGTFNGSANATANYPTLSSLGAAAHGVVTSPGEGTLLALDASAGAAFFDDILTATSPLIPSGSPGFVRYRFAFDGALSTPGPVEPFVRGSARAVLNIQHQGGPILRIVEVDSTKGSLGTIDFLDGTAAGWTAGVGSISGAGIFTSTIHGTFADLDLPMNWGQPWELKVGLMAWVIGTGDAGFLTRLTDVQLFDAGHRPVTDFSLVFASAQSDGGVPGVPAPTTLVLIVAGLAAIHIGRRGRPLGLR
jgi:hypothetical protein